LLAVPFVLAAQLFAFDLVSAQFSPGEIAKEPVTLPDIIDR
jgi:hypothetical protein